jgi:hypothetical protein
MKVHAAQRLGAMKIAKGDNLHYGASLAKKYLGSVPAYDFELLYQHNNQLVLLARDMSFLVTCVDQQSANQLAQEVGRSEKPLKRLGAASIDAFVSVTLDGVVEAVWVAPNLRGKGYGIGLYKLAHQLSRDGIESSDKLGSMSLATWLRIYKSVPKVQLVVDGTVVPRKNVEVEGLDITVKGFEHPLTDPKGPTFMFRWPR